MNRKILPAFQTIAFISSLLLCGYAQAHQVWIEQDAKEAKLYFGYYGGNLREASPGLLDKFVKPTAMRLTARGTEPLTLTKTAGAFVISGRAGSGEALVAEEASYPSFERKEGDKALRGTYVLQLSHSDKTPGERAGEKYDTASYVTSLTLMQGLVPRRRPHAAEQAGLIG